MGGKGWKGLLEAQSRGIEAAPAVGDNGHNRGVGRPRCRL